MANGRRGTWAGQQNPKFGKPPPHPKSVQITIQDRTYRFRSSWEAAFAEYLTQQGVDWEYEKLTLPLTGGRSFTCDFVVRNTIFEVKGFWRDDAKEKWEQAQREYPQYTFVLIQLGEMQQLGVLSRARQLKKAFSV